MDVHSSLILLELHVGCAFSHTRRVSCKSIMDEYREMQTSTFIGIPTVSPPLKTHTTIQALELMGLFDSEEQATTSTAYNYTTKPNYKVSQ